MMEGGEDVEASLVAHGDAAEPGEPRQCALDLPAVAAQAFAGFDAAPSDARDDGAAAQRAPAAGKIVALIGVQLGGTTAGPAGALTDRRNRVDGGFQHAAVVDVGRRQDYGQRNAVGIDDHVALGARFAAVGRVRAGVLAPLFAGTLALSSAARLQSMAFARPKRSSRRRCSVSHTPAACQSRSRRQHVIPEPQPISCGSISQGMPLFSTNRMPVNAARSSSGGRPPLGRGGRAGITGATTAHSASVTRGFAMPLRWALTNPDARFC